MISLRISSGASPKTRWHGSQYLAQLATGCCKSPERSHQPAPSFSPLPPGALSERCDRTVQCDGRGRGKHYYQRMKVSVLLPAGLLAAVLLSTIPAHSRDQTALDRYVATPDASYHDQLLNSVAGDGYTAYVLELTSQRWRTATCCSTVMGGSARHSPLIGCISTKVAMLYSHRGSSRCWTVFSPAADDRAKNPCGVSPIVFHHSGTEGSNPVSSSEESLSAVNSRTVGEKPRSFAAVCTGSGTREGDGLAEH